MGTFSQIHGYSSIEEAFQRERVSDALRTKLWNLLKIFIWDKYGESEAYDFPIKFLWHDLLQRDLDSLIDRKVRSYDDNGWYSQLKVYFFDCKWYEMYDFLEAIVDLQKKVDSKGLQKVLNSELEKQNSAYRFVSNKILEVTSESEIKAIEESISDAKASVKEHLLSSLGYLGNLQDPDYRNSIKESISAVEAELRNKMSDPNITLHDALRKFGNQIHPAMKAAFEKLYAYTSDESGIRHSLTENPERLTSYAEAKFMLVACSAFISYLQTLNA